MKAERTQKKQFILAVSGVKNSGKTTLITKILPLLKAKGLNVAVIKHDGHDFETTNYLEDNFQHFNSGAKKSIVFSKNKWLLVEKDNKSLEDMIEIMSDMDIVFI